MDDWFNVIQILRREDYVDELRAKPSVGEMDKDYLIERYCSQMPEMPLKSVSTVKKGEYDTQNSAISLRLRVKRLKLFGKSGRSHGQSLQGVSPRILENIGGRSEAGENLI